jgi:hypothetical protein
LGLVEIDGGEAGHEEYKEGRRKKNLGEIEQ